MTHWDYAPYDKYNRQVKHYDKKHKDELVAILENLGKYMKALRLAGSPQHVTGKYIHKTLQRNSKTNKERIQWLKNMEA